MRVKLNKVRKWGMGTKEEEKENKKKQIRQHV